MAGNRVLLGGVQQHAVHGCARSILAVGVLSMELCADCSGRLLAMEQCLGSCSLQSSVRFAGTEQYFLVPCRVSTLKYPIERIVATNCDDLEKIRHQRHR